MNRLPRVLSLAVVGGTLALPVGALAAPETAPAAEAAAPANPAVTDAVENFWHYARIYRYDAARAAAGQILKSGAKPREVTEAFERIGERSSVNVDVWLSELQGIAQLKDAANQLTQVVNQGHREQSQDVNLIKRNIQRLGGTARGRELATAQLRESGELAAAIMVQYLQDPREEALHFPIRQALQSMGQVTLAPLTTATATRDENTLVTILTVLGNIGYKDAAPYVAQVAGRGDIGAAAKAAAAEALANLGVPAGEASPGNLFYELGDRFYYDQANIKADPRQPMADVWTWNGNALDSTPVPSAIYNEIMAMRAAEQSIRLGGLDGQALSLWLAANYKRETEAPAGSLQNDQPDAHYYGVSAGARYLNEVLARSLRDGNSAVSLKAIASLQDIVGRSNMPSQPLTLALQSPSRAVRQSAAFAIASALPNQAFQNQERVVPLLSEAIGQSGKASVLVVAGSEGERTRLANELAKSFTVASGVGPQNALAQAATLPSVDVILVARDVRESDIDQLLNTASQNVRIQNAAKVLLRTNRGGGYAAMAMTDPTHTINVSTAADAAGVMKSIDEAHQRAGGGSMDAAQAGEQSLRAAHLLRDLAINGNTVLDASVAEPALLGALNDARPEVAMAAGEVLALVNSARVQPALLTSAMDEKLAEPLRVSFLKSLASSAKFWGNRLGENNVGPLQQMAGAAQSLAVRSAAAEAVGALNLPTQQASQLILQRAAQPMKAMTAQPMAAPAAAQPAAPAEQPAAPAEQPAPAAGDAAQPAPAGQDDATK